MRRYLASAPNQAARFVSVFDLHIMPQPYRSEMR
jgi:hypothetical protein